jgi:hypothetical protein
MKELLRSCAPSILIDAGIIFCRTSVLGVIQSPDERFQLAFDSRSLQYQLAAASALTASSLLLACRSLLLLINEFARFVAAMLCSVIFLPPCVTT